jgi:hypothetical protein
MSRYYNYSRNSYTSDWKSYIGPILVGIVVVIAIAWGIAECCCTRTFIGKLASKESTISYSHDRERTVVNTSVDEDGDVHTSVDTEGENETICRINYRLTFYSEGELREVSAGMFSGRVGTCNADMAAYHVLMSTHTVPAFYVHSKVDTEYLVTVSGWLLDGKVEDITPMDSIKAE